MQRRCEYAVCRYPSVGGAGSQSGGHQRLHIQPDESVCGLYEVAKFLWIIHNIPHNSLPPPRDMHGLPESCAAIPLSHRSIALSTEMNFSVTVFLSRSAMANALQVGEDRLAGDALSVSLILAAVAGTIFLIALRVTLAHCSISVSMPQSLLLRLTISDAIRD